MKRGHVSALTYGVAVWTRARKRTKRNRIGYGSPRQSLTAGVKIWRRWVLIRPTRAVSVNSAFLPIDHVSFAGIGLAVRIGMMLVIVTVLGGV